MALTTNKNKFFHILFWLIYLTGDVILTIISSFKTSGQESIAPLLRIEFFSSLFTVPCKIIFAYLIIYLVLKPLLGKKNSKLMTLLALIGSLTFSLALLRTSIFLIVFPKIYQYDMSTKSFFNPQGIIINFFDLIVPACLITIFELFSHTKTLLARQNYLEREKLQTEYNFLKAQVNPHFLFNTLNSFFAIAQKNDVPELEKGIAKLSAMMRFMIYESNTHSILLTKEIQYILDFIDIYKLRVAPSENSNILFRLSGNPEKLKIAPFLLIPLIENAIKHGIHVQNPSSVEINLECSDFKIHLTIINTNNARQKYNFDESYGIGLVNVQKRLNMLYPEAYEFVTKIENNFYYTSLSIKLT
jgi:two-component system, LytTR family, sensor kinase